VALALNDDFFLLRPHAVSDFHTPFYGSVIRFDHNVSGRELGQWLIAS
jgi:3-O-alpha-D-mannopyranosyl-alpha-D-mannopyranose xylosylphosphotransferase